MKKTFFTLLAVLSAGILLSCNQAETPSTTPIQKTYTITFDANGGEGESYTQTFTEGVSQELSANGFKMPSGKGLAGWATDANATERDYKKEDIYTATSNTTLYAVWVDNIENVTASIDGVVLTIKEGGTRRLKEELHFVVDDAKRPTITKIIIEEPSSGARITPESDLTDLFSDPDGFDDYDELISFEGLENIDVSQVTVMREMFRGCYALQELDISSFDTTNVTSFEEMFTHCSNLKTLDLTNFNTLNATDIGGMFSHCYKLETLDISSFQTTKLEGYDMFQLFYGCRALKYVDVSGIDTTNVTQFQYVFSGCESLTKLDLSSWDTTNLTSTFHMFKECTNLTELNLTGWNTANTTDIWDTFAGCTSLLPSEIIKDDTTDLSGIQEQIETHLNM